MLIRFETEADHLPIFELTTRAFAPMAFSDGTEPAIIGVLRDLQQLSLSLVMEKADEIVGHVAFSPVKIGTSEGDWYGLGPISVEPELQRQGIGGALVERGLSELAKKGAAGCALIGNPKVYGPMGFQSGGLTYRDVPPEIVQFKILTGSPPQGELRFSDAFDLKPES